MNILSLFDGMSCGRIALERASIKVDNYFASEIDKYAIKIAQKNYLDTYQLGDINNWKEWKLPKIDMIIGGSPCQGFSNAGEGLNFDDPRSKLFFVFVDILKYYKPKYFLLENVKMKKAWANVISDYLGVRPIEINSALVSAQNRKRLYWTNISSVIQPEDKQIYLKDIIESGDVDREKSYCIDANYFKGGNLKRYFDKSSPQLVEEKPHQSSKRLMVKINGHGFVKTKEKEVLKSDTLRFASIQNYFVEDCDRCIQVGEATEINGYDIVKMVYSVEGKSPSLTTMQGGHREPKIATSETTWRKLTPLECERLQTVPEGYTEGVSNTQRYKMLGNGWTVDVIAHIFSFLPVEYRCQKENL